MMESGDVLGLTLAGLAMAGSVLAWLVRIEHRLTRMETTIMERLPPHPRG